MKKYLLIPTLFFTFLMNATAQRNSITIGTDVIAVVNESEEAGAYAGITLGFEPALNNYFTIQLHGTMRTSELRGTNILNIRNRFKNLDAGINFYPFKSNRWLYLGVAGTYTNLDFNIEGEDPPILPNGQARFMGGGVNTGLKIPLGKHVSLGGQLGMKYLRSLEGLDDLAQLTAGAKLSFNF